MTATKTVSKILLLAAAWILLPVVAGAEYEIADLEYRNPPSVGGDGFFVTFVGTTTLVISDGETILITDGYFSRVGVGVDSEPGARIEPDRKLVTRWVERLGLDQAAAVMVVHSHFDHSMDAPIVAELTGADLLGSESTANIGRGLELAEDQIRVVTPGGPMTYGDFTITFFISKHWPLAEPLASIMLGATIDEPLVPPAPFDAYVEGKTYSILLEHPLGNILIQGSAGYLPGALEGVKADVVMLSTGGLGDLPAQEQENYFREIVTVTGARKIFSIHWDDAAIPLREPLVPYEDFQRAMQFLEKKKGETGVSYALLPFAEVVQLNPRSPDLQ